VTEEYYQSLQAEYKDFVDTCCESYPIFRNWSSFMTWADKIEQKISNLEAELAEWRADAERLASAETEICSEGDEEYIYCVHSGSCGSHTYRRRDAEFIHAPNCPITLHRELVAKYGQVVDK
jgi:hypothetical protein